MKATLEIRFEAEVDSEYRLESTETLRPPWLEGEVFTATASPWTVATPMEEVPRNHVRVVRLRKAAG